MKKFNVIDLFTGCGGLVDGFEQTCRFNVIACVEWEKSSCLTLVKRLGRKWRYNNPTKRVLRFDIQRSEELIAGWTNDPVYGSGCGLDSLISENGRVDLIIGGPPCQAYSVAGRIRDEYGMHYDYRNFLFESYLKVVRHYRPKVIVFENVPGMLSAKPGGFSIADRITEAFNDAGYAILHTLREHALIDLTSFGVPQRRSRVILVGINQQILNGESDQLLTDFYDKILTRYKTSVTSTVRDAIADLPPFFPLKKAIKKNGRMISHSLVHQSKFLNHIPRYHNSRDIEIFRELAADIEKGTNRYATIKSLNQLYTAKTGRTSNIHKYYVLRWDEPSNTIPAHIYKDGLRHIHPDSRQARSLSVREAARLQTFDDDFEFLGSMGDQYKMIGNAVPPLFARKLGAAIYELMTNLINYKGASSVGSEHLCSKTI